MIFLGIRKRYPGAEGVPKFIFFPFCLPSILSPLCLFQAPVILPKTRECRSAIYFRSFSRLVIFFPIVFEVPNVFFLLGIYRNDRLNIELEALGFLIDKSKLFITIRMISTLFCLFVSLQRITCLKKQP